MSCSHKLIFNSWEEWEGRTKLFSVDSPLVTRQIRLSSEIRLADYAGELLTQMDRADVLVHVVLDLETAATLVALVRPRFAVDHGVVV